VILASILFHFVYRWTQGVNFLAPEMAHHVLESLNPIHSLTIPFAVFTGALLWLSTVLAGSVESWASRLGCTPKTARSMFGISVNIFMGLLLGASPAIGAAIGIPLDVRHFTLSTGTLALAVCSLGSASIAQGLVMSLVGIAVIGLVNFSVTFALSLTWSAFARGVRRAHLSKAFGMAFQFNGFPTHFFLPTEVPSVGFSQNR
jgi:site-specific recombinase